MARCLNGLPRPSTVCAGTDVHWRGSKNITHRPQLITATRKWSRYCAFTLGRGEMVCFSAPLSYHFPTQAVNQQVKIQDMTTAP